MFGASHREGETMTHDNAVFDPRRLTLTFARRNARSSVLNIVLHRYAVEHGRRAAQ